MQDQDIVQWLQSHPDFFERHAEWLANVTLTSPHGGRAVSLQERQMEVLREKNKSLEMRLAKFLRHGHENDRTQQRLHTWLTRVLAEEDPHTLPYTVLNGLHEIFDVPSTAMRIWGMDENYAHLEFAAAVSEDVKLFANSLATPYCGENADFDAAQWLDSLAPVESIAMIALRKVGTQQTDEAAFGLLVLGSPDMRRFHTDMGTDYLAQMGELVSAALQRLHAV